MNKKIAIGGVAAAAAVGALVLFSKRGGNEGEPQSLYAAVQEGPLVINVEEYGEIAPSEQITLKNEVQGRTSIITLVPEGKIVQEGEVLVQLDVSSKIDEKDLFKMIVKRSYPSLYRVRPKHIRNLWRGFNLSPRREGASRG